MTIHIRTKRVILHQPVQRTIHPDMQMSNPDFLRGYALGLKEGRHPEAGQAVLLTDEHIIAAVKECPDDEPDALAYVLGNYIGLIIGRSC